MSCEVADGPPLSMTSTFALSRPSNAPVEFRIGPASVALLPSTFRHVTLKVNCYFYAVAARDRVSGLLGPRSRVVRARTR